MSVGHSNLSPITKQYKENYVCDQSESDKVTVSLC